MNSPPQVLDIPKHHYKYWIYQTIFQAKPIKFIIKLYTYHITLWVKLATHQKCSAACLSKLDNMVNNISLLIQSMLNSLKNGRLFLIFTTPLLHTTTPIISIENQFLYFSQFSPPYSTITYS